MPLKHLHWVIVGAVSVMKTEMGHIQDEHRRKPSPQQGRHGACVITAAPQRQDPAEHCGLNLSLNCTWGVSGTYRLPVSVEVQAKWEGEPALRARWAAQGQCPRMTDPLQS